MQNKALIQLIGPDYWDIKIEKFDKLALMLASFLAQRLCLRGGACSNTVGNGLITAKL